MRPALSQFKKEIRHFSLVSLFNLVFAAVTMAFGIAYIVAAVFGQGIDPATTGLRILTGTVAMACFGLGIGWLLSTVRVFEGVEEISDELDTAGDAITDDRITCLIVRMLACYRDNRDTIRTMILVSTLGGCCFFVLGIVTSLKALTAISCGVAFTLDYYLVIPAMVFMFGIALTSLLSSWYFSKFSRVWDKRLHEIDESECALQEKLGLDKA